MSVGINRPDRGRKSDFFPASDNMSDQKLWHFGRKLVGAPATLWNVKLTCFNRERLLWWHPDSGIYLITAWGKKNPPFNQLTEDNSCWKSRACASLSSADPLGRVPCSRAASSDRCLHLETACITVSHRLTLCPADTTCLFRDEDFSSLNRAWCMPLTCHQAPTTATAAVMRGLLGEGRETRTNAASCWCPTDLRDEFRLFRHNCPRQPPTLPPHPTLQSALLSKPMQTMSLQGRHTTNPLRAPHPEMLANHNARRHPNPSRWQLRAPPGNPLCVWFGAFWGSLNSVPAQCSDRTVPRPMKRREIRREAETTVGVNQILNLFLYLGEQGLGQQRQLPVCRWDVVYCWWNSGK